MDVIESDKISILGLVVDKNIYSCFTYTPEIALQTWGTFNGCKNVNISDNSIGVWFSKCSWMINIYSLLADKTEKGKIMYECVTNRKSKIINRNITSCGKSNIRGSRKWIYNIGYFSG